MALNYDYKNLEVNGTSLKRNVALTRIKKIISENIFDSIAEPTILLLKMILNT